MARWWSAPLRLCPTSEEHVETSAQDRAQGLGIGCSPPNETPGLGDKQYNHGNMIVKQSDSSL